VRVERGLCYVAKRLVRLLYRIAAKHGTPFAREFAHTLGRRRVDTCLSAQLNVTDIESGVARIGQEIAIDKHGA
jgi:hypothetical protein